MEIRTEYCKIPERNCMFKNSSTDWHVGPHKPYVTNEISYLGIAFTFGGSMNWAALAEPDCEGLVLL